MTRILLSNFDAVTFDVYGTLIDWEPSIIAFLTNWAHQSGLDTPGDELLMAYDRARAVIQTERPAHLYSEILRRCFDQICADYGVAPDPVTREKFARSPLTWPAYPDSHDALLALQATTKVCALSNIDEASLQASSKILGFTFDLIVTAERVGAYKPDVPHFRTAIEELGALGIPPQRILHVGQSLRADIVPANRLGLTSVWVHRPDRVLGLSGAPGAKPDLTVSTMAELVVAVGA